MPRFVELVFGFVFASFQKPREFLSSSSSEICELDDRYGSWAQVDHRARPNQKKRLPEMGVQLTKRSGIQTRFLE